MEKHAQIWLQCSTSFINNIQYYYTNRLTNGNVPTSIDRTLNDRATKLLYKNLYLLVWGGLENGYCISYVAHNI